jgi:hypothetical protein
MTTLKELVEEYNRDVYGGKMPTHNKEVLLTLLEREDRFESRDLTSHGQDAGEPPMGAIWESEQAEALNDADEGARAEFGQTYKSNE